MMLFNVDGAIGRVVVVVVATPHGEYSTSNVGKVVAYGVGAGVEAMLGRASIVANVAIGDCGGVLANGRFRLGVTVVADEFEFFGVKLRTSRNA